MAQDHAQPEEEHPPRWALGLDEQDEESSEHSSEEDHVTLQHGVPCTSLAHPPRRGEVSDNGQDTDFDIKLDMTRVKTFRPTPYWSKLTTKRLWATSG